MDPLIWALSIILVGLCAVIVFLILGQDVRGGGLAGALGGGSAQSAFGSKTTETVLKLTAYLAGAIFLLVIVLILLHARQVDPMTTGPDPMTTPVETSTDAPTETPTETPAVPIPTTP